MAFAAFSLVMPLNSISTPKFCFLIISFAILVNPFVFFILAFCLFNCVHYTTCLLSNQVIFFTICLCFWSKGVKEYTATIHIVTQTRIKNVLPIGGTFAIVLFYPFRAISLYCPFKESYSDCSGILKSS